MVRKSCRDSMMEDTNSSTLGSVTVDLLTQDSNILETQSNNSNATYTSNNATADLAAAAATQDNNHNKQFMHIYSSSSSTQHVGANVPLNNAQHNNAQQNSNNIPAPGLV